MIRRILFATLPWIWLLTGCAEREKTVFVNVPVPVPCIEQVDPLPEWFDSKEAVKGTYDRGENVDARTALLLAGRLQRDRLIDEQQAALLACSAR